MAAKLLSVLRLASLAATTELAKLGGISLALPPLAFLDKDKDLMLFQKFVHRIVKQPNFSNEQQIFGIT